MRRSLAVALILLAGSFAILAPANADPAATTEAFLASLAAPLPEADPAALKPEGGASRAWVTAYCWDGSSVSCSGSSVSATDSNCAAGERGSCWGSSTGTRLCPACPSGGGAFCSTVTQCANGSTVTCSGDYDCFSMTNCYAECDWGTSVVWCPGAQPWNCPFR
jgi:hypothetical protein